MKEIVAQRNIRIQTQVKDWEEGIRSSAALLERSGAIKAGYIDSMVRMVEELGPYIVLMPGLAMPHAAPSSDVLRDDVSLLILEKPVKFNCENDPVTLIISICSTDGNAHLNTLRALSEMLSNEEKVEQLKRCRNVEDAYQLINS